MKGNTGTTGNKLDRYFIKVFDETVHWDRFYYNICESAMKSA